MNINVLIFSLKNIRVYYYVLNDQNKIRYVNRYLPTFKLNNNKILFFICLLFTKGKKSCCSLRFCYAYYYIYINYMISF